MLGVHPASQRDAPASSLVFRLMSGKPRDPRSGDFLRVNLASVEFIDHLVQEFLYSLTD